MLLQYFFFFFLHTNKREKQDTTVFHFRDAFILFQNAQCTALGKQVLLPSAAHCALTPANFSDQFWFDSEFVSHIDWDDFIHHQTGIKFVYSSYVKMKTKWKNEEPFRQYKYPAGCGNLFLSKFSSNLDNLWRI